MERAAGIEPACLTWKDSALPLSYARMNVLGENLTFKGDQASIFYVFLNYLPDLFIQKVHIDKGFPYL